MARKSPLGKIKDAALDTIKDPIGSGSKAVGQAVGQAMGTVELGRAVAGQVTGQAISRATGTVGVVTSLVPGLKKHGAPSTPVAPSEDPVGRTAPETTEPPAGTTAKKASEPSRPQGDPLKPATKAPATKAPATKAPATKAPAAKKAPVAKVAGDQPVKPPVEDVATAAVKKAATQATPAKGSLSEATTRKGTAKTAKKAAKTAEPTNAIDAAADVEDVDVTPADIAAAVAKKAPAKKAPANKTPARKTPAAKRTASGDVPLSAAELAGGAGTEAITPAGTRGAGVPTNPDTTETGFGTSDAPLIEPGQAKAVASEAETSARASDTDKG